MDLFGESGKRCVDTPIIRFIVLMWSKNKNQVLQDRYLTETETETDELLRTVN